MRARVAIIECYAISPPVPHVHGPLRAPAPSRPLAGVPVPLHGPPPGRGHGGRPIGHSPRHGLPPGGARHPRGAAPPPRALPESGEAPPGAARARPGPPREAGPAARGVVPDRRTESEPGRGGEGRAGTAGKGSRRARGQGGAGAFPRDAAGRTRKKRRPAERPVEVAAGPHAFPRQDGDGARRAVGRPRAGRRGGERGGHRRESDRGGGSHRGGRRRVPPDVAERAGGPVHLVFRVDQAEDRAGVAIPVRSRGGRDPGRADPRFRDRAQRNGEFDRADPQLGVEDPRRRGDPLHPEGGPVRSDPRPVQDRQPADPRPLRLRPRRGAPAALFRASAASRRRSGRTPRR